MKFITLLFIIILLLSCTDSSDYAINNAIESIKEQIEIEFDNLEIPKIPKIDYPNLLIENSIVFDNTLDIINKILIDLTDDSENYLCYFSFINKNPIDMNLIINELPIKIDAFNYKNEFLIVNFEKKLQISTFDLLNFEIRMIFYLY